MNKDYYLLQFSLAKRIALPIFVFVSLCGVLVGVLLAKTQAAVLHIPVSVLLARPSWVLLLLTIAIPVCVFSFALKKRVQILLLLFVFAWSVCRGFCGMLLFSLVGDSAWFVRCLLLFSSNAISVFTYWLLARHCERIERSFLRDVYFISFLSAIVFALDIFLISPFASYLLMYY